MKHLLLCVAISMSAGASAQTDTLPQYAPHDRVAGPEIIRSILGSERTGGWVGAQWSKASARTAKDDIRTWGQLGLTGEWADKPIHMYGYDLSGNSFCLSMQRMAMGGGDLWNPALQESALNEVGRLLSAGPRPPQGCETIAAALARDPYGIAYTAAQCVRKTQQVRAVPLAERDGMPYVEASRENMLNRTYPLVEGIYVYINRPPGKPVEPKLKEFLKYILSRHGQEDVLADGGYLPLPAEAVAQELKKLE